MKGRVKFPENIFRRIPLIALLDCLRFQKSKGLLRIAVSLVDFTKVV